MSARALYALIIMVSALQNQIAVNAHAAGPNSASDGPTARVPPNEQRREISDLVLTDSDRLPVSAVMTDGARLLYRRLSDVAEPAELRSVHADLAEVDDAELAVLAKAKELRFLVLPGFQESKPADIGDAGLEQISLLTSLKYLSVGTERATDAGVSQLRRLTGLRRLELYAPGATDASIMRVGELPNLIEVALHVPSMTDAALAQFPALNNLLDLDVAGTSITGSAFASLASRNQLVCLRGNFTDDGLRVIGRAPWSRLANIDLVGKQTTAEGLRHLTAVPSLTRVGLHGTGITAEAMRDLRRNYPRLFEVERD